MDTILEIKCQANFKEQHYSCSLKPFYWIFADIPASGSSFFWLVETEFSSDPSSRLVYTDFGLTSNMIVPCFKQFSFIQSFFCVLLESITEIKYKPAFFRYFHFLTVKAVFLASGNGFSIKCYSFRRVGTDFFI